MLIHFQ